MRKKPKHESKYTVPKGSLVCVSIILILSLVIYIACLTIEYQSNALLEQGAVISNFKMNFIRIAKDITLIIISVMATSIAGVLLIDVKSKNYIHKEIVQNDIILSTDYYESLTSKNKLAISEHLDSILFFKRNDTLAEMSSGLKRKISNFAQQNYYFSSYSAIINCKIDNGRIVKK